MYGDELRSTADLMNDEGLSRYSLRQACRAGQWDHVRRGVYARSRDVDDHASHRRLILATLPEIGQESVVSHLSAAALHGLPLYRGMLDRVWVTRPSGGMAATAPCSTCAAAVWKRTRSRRWTACG